MKWYSKSLFVLISNDVSVLSPTLIYWIFLNRIENYNLRVTESSIESLNNTDGPPVSLHDEMFIGTAVFTLLTGIGFIVAGKRGKQFWIAFWGATMVVASISYLTALALGYR